MQSLQRERDDADKVFKQLFEEIQRKAEIAGPEIEKPRTCRHYTLRAKVEGSAEEYFRRSAFNPFLDHVLQEMRTRFPEGGSTQRMLAARWSEPAQCRSGGWAPELLWERSAISCDLSPRNHHVEDPLGVCIICCRAWHNHLPPRRRTSIEVNFPNVYTPLHFLLLIPVTSATVERANSALKFVKTEKRSRMGECRLNASVLLFVHKDTEVDLDKVPDIFMTKKARRMTLSNPLE